MLYKTEDSFSNYKNVKREVPERDTFLKMIVDNVYNYCDTIEIAEPNTELAKILNETKCKIVDDNLKINSAKVIPIKLINGGIPSVDSSNEAIKKLNNYADLDFPNSGIKFNSEGEAILNK